LVGKDYAKAPWFKEVLKKGQYISDIFLGHRRIPHFIIALKQEVAEDTPLVHGDRGQLQQVLLFWSLGPVIVHIRGLMG